MKNKKDQILKFWTFWPLLVEFIFKFVGDREKSVDNTIVTSRRGMKICGQYYCDLQTGNENLNKYNKLTYETLEWDSNSQLQCRQALIAQVVVNPTNIHMIKIMTALLFLIGFSSYRYIHFLYIRTCIVLNTYKNILLYWVLKCQKSELFWTLFFMCR